MNFSTLLKDYQPDEIAKYFRLSLEDRSKKGGLADESESIANQRRIINQFIDLRGNCGEKCKEFIDDGRSGTNFDRPGWKELLEQVEDGKIKVVIVKNLSRLGRSNFECGYYMDYYFPSIGVRFMTVQEEVDYHDLIDYLNENRHLFRNTNYYSKMLDESDCVVLECLEVSFEKLHNRTEVKLVGNDQKEDRNHVTVSDIFTKICSESYVSILSLFSS